VREELGEKSSLQSPTDPEAGTPTLKDFKFDEALREAVGWTRGRSAQWAASPLSPSVAIGLDSAKNPPRDFAKKRACELPDDLGRSLSVWTCGELTRAPRRGLLRAGDIYS